MKIGTLDIFLLGGAAYTAHRAFSIAQSHGPDAVVREYTSAGTVSTIAGSLMFAATKKLNLKVRSPLIAGAVALTFGATQQIHSKHLDMETTMFASAAVGAATLALMPLTVLGIEDSIGPFRTWLKSMGSRSSTVNKGVKGLSKAISLGLGNAKKASILKHKFGRTAFTLGLGFFAHVIDDRSGYLQRRTKGVSRDIGESLGTTYGVNNAYNKVLNESQPPNTSINLPYFLPTVDVNIENYASPEDLF